MSLADLLWPEKTPLSREELDRRARIIHDRLVSLEAFAPDWVEEVNLLRSVGLERINNALLPAYQQIIEIANLGALLSTTSESEVTIGNGAKTFTVPETKRLNFAPTPYLIAYANGDFDLSMIGQLSSYDSETGQLVIAVESFKGDGTFASWNIGPVATTADLETLRDQVQANAAAAQSSEDAAAASAVAAAASAAVADTAADSATSALTTLEKAWYGARITEPEEAELGAQYLDVSQTPNVVKVLTETGWSPTVTISIGGSRQQVYVAAASETGPFTVDGGFTNGSVNINGVELFHRHGVTLDSAAGTFTLDQGRSAGDVIVFRGYQANDATDIFTKSEADLRFVSGKHAQAFSAAEKSRARGNMGADVLAGLRNKIINGNFDIWQRGDSFSPQTSSRHGPDRWQTNASGGTIGLSKQAFAAGQTDVPGNPESFCRVTCSVGNDFTGILQKIEDVRSLSGKKATVTFWAKGTNPGGGKFYCYFSQFFGSGGSASVDTAKSEFVVSAAWQRFQFTIDVSSVAGKTIGANSTIWLGINQATDASTAAWTLDIAHLSVVEDDATGEDDPFSPRHIQQEWALCERYYQQGIWGYCGVRGTAIDGANYLHPFRTNMRATPTVTLEPYGLSDVNLASISTYYLGSAHLGIQAKPTVLTDPVRAYRIFKADAEL